MDDLLSEKEQIDQMRVWWSDYGAYIIGGLVIGIGLILGVNYYRSSQLELQQNASAAFETLAEHISRGDLEASEATAADISEQYSKTIYAGQSGLAMARLFMDKNRDQDAANALLAVVDSETDDELRHVARLRLARIYLYQDKSQETIDLLIDQDVGAFAAAYGEVLGDAYTALGRVEEAQEAYQSVLLDPLSEGTVDRQLVQWKALDLPEATVAEVTTDEPITDEQITDEPAADETVETSEASIEDK